MPAGTDAGMLPPLDPETTLMRRTVAVALACLCLSSAAQALDTVVAVGASVAATSPDGITWTAQTIPAGTYNAVAWSGTVFAAVGTSIAATSPDGVAWTAATIPSGTWAGIAWNGTVFAAVGPNVAATSPNGTAWTSRTIPFGVRYNAVVWAGTQFVAIGSTGAATSPDGITWTARTISTSAFLYDVAWSGSVLAVTGEQATAHSPDGASWTAQSSGATLFGVAWNGSVFASVGPNTAQESLDGVGWTARTIPLGTYFRLAWTNTLFVAVGASVAATSPDGASWTSQAIPAGNYYAVAVSNIPAPLISAIGPTVGQAGGGTSVTIAGTGFRPGATVTFGGTAASIVTVVNSSEITATTPAHTPGQVDVTVTNVDSQSSTLSGGFAYYASNAPTPTVAGVSPSHGATAGGDSVTVTGTGFQPGATVSLGGTPATNVAVSSASRLTATVPAHAAGAVTVAISNPDSQSGSLDAAYTYDAVQAPAPTLTAISNPGGLTTGGYALTLTGTGFQTGATVTFGGTLATSVVVVSASEITLTAPAHDKGAVDVVVTNPDSQTATLTAGFIYATPKTGCGQEGGAGALALLAGWALSRRRGRGALRA